MEDQETKKKSEHSRFENHFIHIFLMNVKDVNENYIEKTLFTRLRRFLEFLKYQDSVS